MNRRNGIRNIRKTTGLPSGTLSGLRPIPMNPNGWPGKPSRRRNDSMRAGWPALEFAKGRCRKFSVLHGARLYE
jgi:hypothetical protein